MATAELEAARLIPYRTGPEHCSPFHPLDSDVDKYFRVESPEKRSAFQVFDEQIKRLRLDCFPYRDTFTKTISAKGTRAPIGFKVKAEEFDWDDFDEKSFLIKWRKSPWYTQCDWTDDLESIQLRLLKAKRQPKMSSVFQQLTNVFFCGKEITTIDPQLMVLRNLQVLSIPNNRIEKVDLGSLGPSVQHLELFGNSIKEITGTRPRDLQHIGIGFNDICQLEPVLEKAELKDLISIDISGNHIRSMKDMIAALRPLTGLKNLHAAGNHCSLFRTYTLPPVQCFPNLVSLDGQHINAEAREEQLSISYDQFKTVDATQQSVILLIVDDIKGLPQPEGYKSPLEQESYPLTKWVYTVQALFPGTLLSGKPLPPPPTPEQLKADEKAKKEKEAKSKKNPKSPLPTPVVEVQEPDDPLYDSIPGIQKVASESVDWAWADPLTIGVPVPLLFMADNGDVLYEYLRRGMKVKLLQKKLLFTPKPAAGGKKTTKASKTIRMTKGQKPDLWDVPLANETVESTELTSCVVPTLALLHGDREATFRWDFLVKTVVQEPAAASPSPVAGNKKGKAEPKGAKGKGKGAPVEAPVEIKLVPATINFRVKVLHDQRQNDLLIFPPEVARPDGGGIDAVGVPASNANAKQANR